LHGPDRSYSVEQGLSASPPVLPPPKIVLVSTEIELEANEIREKLDELAEDQRKEEQSQSWLKGLALSTALMAVLAAVSALQASFHADEALLASNQAILAQAKASDTWTEFQADGLKDILRQFQASQTSDPQAAADLRAEAKARSDKAGQEFDQARQLEEQRDRFREDSDKAAATHKYFAWSVGALQVGIALASVAALTRRKVVWWLGGGFGALGAGLLGWGFSGGML